MSDHQCACRTCAPALDPHGDRKDEGHLAIRFGDQAAQVYLGNEEVRNCYEVDCVAGKAWLYTEPRHKCLNCRGDVCAHVAEGDYRVGVRKRVTSQ